MPDWDAVYSEKNILNASAAKVLRDNSHLLSNGAALDFASGLGGNALFLAQKNYTVECWDLSSVAINKINQHAAANNLNICAQAHDLENALPQVKEEFDLIVVSYFLHRETLRYLYDVLRAGGLLFYQTFSGKQVSGQGPARADFRLKENELLTVFSDMKIMFYREEGGEVFFVGKKVS